MGLKDLSFLGLKLWFSGKAVRTAHVVDDDVIFSHFHPSRMLPWFWVLSFGGWVGGFGLEGSGLRVRVWGFRFSILDFEFRCLDLRARVERFGFRVKG